MWQSLLEFFSFNNANVIYVTIGTMLIGASSAIVGSFSVLQKRALIGDVISHSVLPGICLAFILFETKNPYILLTGAFISGWISILVVDFITQNSKIKSDAAIGITLSVFFGLGMLMLTSIQHNGNASQSGLDRFLFGKAAAIVGQDLYLITGMSIFLLTVVFIFLKPFTFVAFDKNFALSQGLPVKFYEFVLSSITVLAVTVGIQAVGVILMSALLITPAVAARFLTDKLPVMLIIAAALSSVCCLLGAYVSFVAPSMPTGPWIIVILMTVAMTILFFAPKKGLFIKRMHQQSNFKQILNENVLKLMYQLCEPSDDFTKTLSLKQLIDRRDMGENMTKTTLSRLVKLNLVQKNKDGWKLNAEGTEIGQRMVRLHRLWEVYLTHYLNLPSDHVHETAEAMEHILTPEMEKELELLLDKPAFDPHKSKIPYKT